MPCIFWVIHLSAPDPSSEIWLGASDLDTEGTWIWEVGGEVVPNIWNMGEPGGALGENCMAWRTPTKAYDRDCSIAAQFICEV